MKVTLGGDRLGSGNKNEIELHNYYRSTHNLSQKFTSPMTVGALYPFLVLPATRGDKFEIDLNADCITVPTTGPLFGSFKMQVDVFECPIRLYQAILHNNPTSIGLKMNQVFLPEYMLVDLATGSFGKSRPINNSALWKYLGLSGLGRRPVQTGQLHSVRRDVNAVPLLAYYDIYKNYYANKQEEIGYIITKDFNAQYVTFANWRWWSDNVIGPADNNNPLTDMQQNGNGLRLTLIISDKYTVSQELVESCIELEAQYGDLYEVYHPKEFATKTGTTYQIQVDNDAKRVRIDFKGTLPLKIDNTPITTLDCNITSGSTDKAPLTMLEFPLKNIDNMRMTLLSAHWLGAPVILDSTSQIPYGTNDFEHSTRCIMNGLALKTYQSDLFNNWINTEWIDGENGIAELTKVATNEGSFKIDALILAEKTYEMLYRIAVNGGTYNDYLDAVYGEEGTKHWETPKYLGGMSSEIVFEQIVSTAATEGQPLGDLAGRGRHVKRKGGHIICKCDEPAFIIGLVSITPRINYNQGNEFYLTEIKSVEDLHKPALDGIGFQNLLGERLVYSDTKVDGDGKVTERSVVGKVPAWIEYMTAVDKTFGDFAEQDGKAFMCLNRNYETNEDGTIRDATTYIDPTKYNYAFANSALDAQNFWVQIQSKIKARRKMSAKQIPNL